MTFILAAVSWLLLIIPVPVQAGGTVRVDLENGSLSVTADNIPLQTILLELVAQGITVKIDPAINPHIRIDFSQRPLEQALESLLKPASYSLIWESRFPHDAPGSLQLAEIQVFQTGSPELMRPLQPRQDTVVIKNSEGVYYVKDEILLYIPSERILAQLFKLIPAYDATVVEYGEPPGPVRIKLPPDADVFEAAREIKERLGLEIAQPHYAYPIQSPVHFPLGTSVTADFDPRYYRPDHNSLAIAVLDSGLADGSGLDKFVLASLDVVTPAAPFTDTLGHGTQMALIASGLVQPYGVEGDIDTYVPIIPVRTFDDSGFTTDLKIMAAVNFALANKARVMSLSWGSETRSDFIGKILAEAGDRGLVIVAAAGNEPTGRPVYPAAYPGVIGVGASGPHGRVWQNSNFGDFVALYAPGFATLPVGYQGEPGMYGGTSIATALVANTIARYLNENPGAALPEIRTYLQHKFQQP